jgi:hypothetical protein
LEEGRGICARARAGAQGGVVLLLLETPGRSEKKGVLICDGGTNYCLVLLLLLGSGDVSV